MNEQADAELLHAWRGGDNEGGGVLFDRYGPKLHRFFADKASASWDWPSPRS